MSRIFCIGDIHGKIDSLRTLFVDHVIPYWKDGDHVVTVGDYIDRGIDSKGVVDFLLDLKAITPTINFHFLKGNHEDMAIEGDMASWLINGGQQTLASYGIPLDDAGRFIDLVPQAHAIFYNSLRMYAVIGRYVFAHAGINPGKSLVDQSYWDLLWSRQYVGYAGKYHDPEHFVVYGHTPVNDPVIRDNQAGIDTGCVFGGKLTCMVIDLETDNRTYHHVRS